MTTKMPFLATALTLALAGQSTAVFEFRPDEFWLNLHKFLYVLGRAQNRTADAMREPVADAPSDSDRGIESLTPAERNAWNDAITGYARGLSRQDSTRDTNLALLEGRLAGAGGSSTLNVVVDDSVRTILERAAPIYRKAWWPTHRATNHAWMATTEQLVAAHGAAVLDFIVRAYRLPWPPQGYPVHIVMYAAWGGAYSTDGSLLVVSSNARAGTTGWSGLETVFHESIHQWDDAVDAILNADARAIAKRLPRNLSHALVFFTAAEAVRHVAPPEYVPLADATGAWSRGMEGLKGALDATWLPYLNGGGTRDEALAALVQRTATQPASAIFTFQTDDFWLNLHHFLHALGVIDAKLPDAETPALAPARVDMKQGLPRVGEDQRRVWSEIIKRYGTEWSRSLPNAGPGEAIVRALAHVGDAPTLASAQIDPSVGAVLEQAAPIYRKAWWPAHRDRNRAWRAQMEPLLTQHGPAIRDFVTRAFAVEWPQEGRLLHVCGYANFGGAYSMVNGGVIVIGSADPNSSGLSGLEAVFHEAAHQWDPQTFAALNAHAKPMNVTIPRDLTHALIFFSAGEAVRRVSAKYQSMADRLGIWDKNLSGATVPASRLKQPLIDAWKPYLDGTVPRDVALDALVKRVTQ